MTVAHKCALLRVGLVSIAAVEVVVGVWALLSPHGFYSSFPIPTQHWISRLGAFDEHLIIDYGSMSLALALVLAWAAVALERRLVSAALAGWLVWAIPHFVYHAINTKPLTAAGNIANLATLGVGLIVSVGLLLLAGSIPLPAAERLRAGSPKG